MTSPLEQIVPNLDRTGVPDTKFPDAKGEYSALCPFHNDHNSGNFFVSEKGFKCFACGESGSLAKLARHFGVELAKSTPKAQPDSGCTLKEYAKAKHLDVEFLQGIGLKTVKVRGKDELHIPYHDENGKLIRTKRRLKLGKEGKGPRFKWKGQGKEQSIYGLDRLALIHQAGWVLLVEGESDCHTAWFYDIPTLGIPGASSWKPEWHQHLEGLAVYVWMEPDHGGSTLVKALGKQIDGLQVIRPGPEAKDISEAHIIGMDVVGMLDDLKKKATTSIEVTQIDTEGMTVYDVAEQIQGIWKDKEIKGVTAKKNAVIDLVTRWLLTSHRLLLDQSEDAGQGGRPYIVCENGEVWPLERDCIAVEKLVYQLKTNPAESFFKILLKALEMETRLHGHTTILERWQAKRGKTLYISSGPCHIVRVIGGALQRVPNGTDDVWFDSSRCYPAWSPAPLVHPRDISAFLCSIETPDEVQTYTEEIQRHLIEIWLCALVSGIRPLPIFLVRGDKGGGKSTVVRAILHTLMGPTADLTQVTDDVRDFQTMAQHMPVVGLDNIDSDPPQWLADTLASIVTGMKANSRELYTNNRLISRRLDASVAITTRTASFARQDIAERSIPIATGSFKDGDRRSDGNMMREVDANRDGLMSWAATIAQGMLAFMDQAPEGLPLRFVDLAKLIWSYELLSKQPEMGASVALALRHAQALVAGECDPLVQALAEGFEQIADNGVWIGMPKSLMDDLRKAGIQMDYMGGGKAIARSLRESANTLSLIGIDARWTKYGNSTRFTLRKNGPSPFPDAKGDTLDVLDEEPSPSQSDYGDLFGLTDEDYDEVSDL